MIGDVQLTCLLLIEGVGGVLDCCLLWGSVVWLGEIICM